MLYRKRRNIHVYETMDCNRHRGGACLRLDRSYIAFFLFTRDIDGFVEKMMASTSQYGEAVIEPGVGNEKIAVMAVDGVIQDLGSASSIFQPAGYNHGLFMQQLNDVLENESIKGIILKVNSPVVE